MPEPIEVRKVPIESVSDASGLTKLIDDGIIDADRVIAVVGKTEGNGGVNDYTRIIADRAFREVLVNKGTRSPTRSSRSRCCGRADRRRALPACHDLRHGRGRRRPADDEPRLSVGFAMSEPILPEEIGRPEMVRRSRTA